jgi:hypothetical protein
MIILAFVLGALGFALLAGASAAAREGDRSGCLVALGFALLGLAYLAA